MSARPHRASWWCRCAMRGGDAQCPDDPSRGGKAVRQDGRKLGLYAQIGTIDPAQPILIAEGFATAATLQEATGMAVIVAFDAGNLNPSPRRSGPSIRLCRWCSPPIMTTTCRGGKTIAKHRQGQS